jgi:CarD family transcriptional regulator
MATNDNSSFQSGEFVVYPAHGVGKIEGTETHTISGIDVSLYIVNFEKDRMRLKIPVTKAINSGLRRLSNASDFDTVIATLQGKSRARRTMWSRRAQEYEAKINSGDPVAIAEVLRDLKKSATDNEQSFSERQIYQAALERLAREYGAFCKTSDFEASQELENLMMQKKTSSKMAA